LKVEDAGLDGAFEGRTRYCTLPPRMPYACGGAPRR
jgi:hypothetical protein